MMKYLGCVLQEFLCAVGPHPGSALHTPAPAGPCSAYAHVLTAVLYSPSISPYRACITSVPSPYEARMQGW